MDKIQKATEKLTKKEKQWTKEIIKMLQSGRFSNLDIKKLKNMENVFRVKKGNIRIVYQIRNNRIFILKVGRRKENTYKLQKMP